MGWNIVGGVASSSLLPSSQFAHALVGRLSWIAIPIDVCPWFPSLDAVAGVLGSELVWVSGVPVVVGALWWCEHVVICGVPLII